MTDTEADLLAEVLLLRQAHQKMHRRAQRAESLHRRQSMRFESRIAQAIAHTELTQQHQMLDANGHLLSMLRETEVDRDDAREWATYLAAFVPDDALEGLDLPEWLPQRMQVTT
jgi:hypothetical protein